MKKTKAFFCFVVAIFTIIILFLLVFFVRNQDGVKISGLRASKADAPYSVRINWNYDNKPLAVRGEYFEEAILAHAPSTIVLNPGHKFSYFKAKIGIDDGTQGRGAVRFGVYADGRLVFVSKVVRGGEPAMPVLVDIAKAKEVLLVVDGAGKDFYDWAVWADSKFLSEIPAGWTLSDGEQFPPRVELRENQLWDTGQRTFPNENGLWWWRVIAGLFYMFLLFYLWSKRNAILILLASLRDMVRLPQVWLLLLTALLMVWVFLPFWGEGLPASWDAGQHYLRAWLMKNLYLSNFRIDGWSPYWCLGVQQFLFYSPFFYFILVAFHFLTFQAISLATCFKILYFFAYFSLPFACYWLMRQFKIDPLPSAIAALGIPAYSAIHGVGIEALCVTGLLPQAFSLTMFCLCLGTLRRLLDSGGWNVLKLALLMAALFVTHVFSSIYFLFCVLIFVLFNLFNTRIMLSIMLASAIGFLIASFDILPFIYYYAHGLSGPETGWGPVAFISSSLSGNYLGPPLINIFAFAGLSISFFLKRRDLKLLAILSVLTYLFYLLFSSSNFLSAVPIMKLVPSQLFKARTLPFFAVFFAVFTGVFYQFAIKHFAFMADRFKIGAKLRRQDLLLGFKLVLVLVVLLSVFIKLAGLKERVKLDSDYGGIKRNAFMEAFKWLRDSTPPNIVVATDGVDLSMSELGFNQVHSQINVQADRYTLVGNQLELTRVQNGEVEKMLAVWPPERSFERLKRYNCSYLFITDDGSIRNLSSRPDLFRPVYDNGIISIWQVAGHDFRYLANDNLMIEEFCFSPERVYWKLENKEADNNLVASIAYHPNWTLSIDSRPARITETHDHLISFRLPSADQIYEVDLKFVRSWWERALYLVSFVSLAGVLLLLLAPERFSQRWIRNEFFKI